MKNLLKNPMMKMIVLSGLILLSADLCEGQIIHNDHVIIGNNNAKHLSTRFVDGKSHLDNTISNLYLNYNTGTDVVIGYKAKPSSLFTTGNITVGHGGNGRLRTRHIDGKRGDNDNYDNLYLNYNTGKHVVIGYKAKPSSLFTTGNITVGHGGNGRLRTRHIDGKRGDNDNYDNLYLNYNTGKHVVIGYKAKPSHLFTTGNITVGHGGNGRLRTRHIDGKRGDNDNYDNLYLNYATGQDVVIGAPSKPSNLSVLGNIGAKKVKVTTAGWADYVFKKEYALPTLEEVAQHIAAKGHLKDIPSAAEVVKEGIDLGAMDAKLLAKIEELTLYTIQQQKEIDWQNRKIEALQSGLEKLLKK